MSYHGENLRSAAEQIDRLVDLDLELIHLTGHNLERIVHELKNGASILYPDKRTPHLIDITCSDDDYYGQGIRVYEMGIGVEWDDLTDYEKRKLYDSQHYLLYKKKRR